MKISLKLKYRLIENGINSFTAKDMMWLGKENGELLNLLIQNKFTGFITIDNNLSFQNNFDNYPIAVIILVAFDNTYETIMEFFEKILECIKEDFNGVRTIMHPGYK
jgi:hypothetical protein